MDTKSEDEKRFDSEDVEYYIDPSNVPKDLLKSLRELKAKELFKAAETLFENLVKVTKMSSNVARQMSSAPSNVKYIVSMIHDEEMSTFLKSMEHNLDDDKETKRLVPDSPRERLRSYLSSEEAQDARKTVVQDFSEVQRRKVVLRSRLEDWYHKNSNLSQIYEPVRLQIQKNSDLDTFSKWLRNVLAYFKRRRRSILRIKRRQHTHYKDDCKVSIREVLREVR